MLDQKEIPFYPKDLMALMGVTNKNTLRSAIKSGRIPQPDVQISRKTRYWHRSTLVKAGLISE